MAEPSNCSPARCKQTSSRGIETDIRAKKPATVYDSKTIMLTNQKLKQ